MSLGRQSKSKSRKTRTAPYLSRVRPLQSTSVMSTDQSIREKQAKSDSGAHLQRLHMAFRQDYHTPPKNAMTTE